jgi:alkylation response protein AidB-like acyl-CoA dehydrogenase
MRVAGERQASTGKKANDNAGSGRREATDLLGLDALFSDEELATREEIRSFVEERIKPNLREWWEGAIFPREACSGCTSKATGAPARAP